MMKNEKHNNIPIWTSLKEDRPQQGLRGLCLQLLCLLVISLITSLNHLNLNHKQVKAIFHNRIRKSPLKDSVDPNKYIQMHQVQLVSTIFLCTRTTHSRVSFFNRNSSSRAQLTHLSLISYRIHETQDCITISQRKNKNMSQDPVGTMWCKLWTNKLAIAV